MSFYNFNVISLLPSFSPRHSNLRTIHQLHSTLFELILKLSITHGTIECLLTYILFGLRDTHLIFMAMVRSRPSITFISSEPSMNPLTTIPVVIYNVNNENVIYILLFQEKCVWNVKHRPVLFLLLLLVVSVISALIYFTTDMFNDPQAIKYKPLEFQKLMSGGYEPHRFNGTWVSGNHI